MYLAENLSISEIEALVLRTYTKKFLEGKEVLAYMN